MDKIMPIDNINVSNVAILPILNGIVPSTHVKPASKLHQDTHHEHVMDASMMMESAAITILKENMRETSLESVEVHVLFMYVFLFNYLNGS
jgi:hypothetical protein